jgi:PAS domain S-box-containing protein
MREALANGKYLHIPPWPLFATALLIVQTAFVLAAHERGPRLACDSAILFVILAAGTSIAALNALRSRHSIRLFWAFMAAGTGLWAANSLLGILYAAGLGRRLPDPMLSASVLFLHTVLLLAAVASRPHVKQLDQRTYGTVLNFLLLLFFWVFLYVFFLMPGQYLNWNRKAVEWFSILYFIENAVLVIFTGILAIRTRGPWKAVYAPLCGSSVLYACGSVVINLKVAHAVYFPGLLDLLTAWAACVLVWAAVRGKQSAPQLAQAVVVERSSRHYPLTLAALTFTIIPLFGLWELSRLKELVNVHTVRVFAVLVAGFLLTLVAFIREYFQHQRFAFDIDLAYDQLHLAMQSGKSIGWDLNVSGKEGLWFGDLQTFFGIPASSYTGPARKFYRSIHPDDRRQVLRTIVKAGRNATSYTVVFRLVLPGGSKRWLTSRGRFYYNSWGKPIRMLGIAIDVNEQKQSEEALHENEDKLRLVLESAPEGIFGIDLNGYCTFCNPAVLNILGYSCSEDLLGHNMHELIHHTRPDGTPYPSSQCPILGTLKTGNGAHSANEVYWKADGTPLQVEYWCLPQRKDGSIVGAVTQFMDITERQRAEEALRESELRFRNMAHAAPMLLWMSGKDGQREYFNQSWLDFTGQAQPRDEWMECIHPDDRERYIKTYNESFAARQAFRVEYQLKRHDGEYRLVLENSVPRFTFGNIFEGYIGCGIDVTEVRRAEKEIALANERLQLALEAGSAEVWNLDIKTGMSILLGNHQALFGTATGPQTLQEFWDCVHPDDLEGLQQGIEAAKRERKRFSEDFRVTRPDKSIRWLHLEGKFVYWPDGEAERMLGIISDMTERKFAAEALEKNEEEFSLAFEAARLGWWVWNEETAHVTLSKGTRAVLGLPAEKEITLDNFLNTVHPEDRERVYRKWWQSFDEGAHFLVEYRVQKPDGGVQWVEARGRAYSSSRSRLVQIVGVTMDISTRKHSEEALHTLGGRLIQAQEQERIRIARELHDDICQRLALLGVEMESLRDNSELTDPKLQEMAGHLAQLTVEIGSSVQALSHQLHSSKLEILGATRAMKSFCAELARQHRVKVEFSSNVTKALPHEVSLCLYRVLQEGLHNAIKHSGMKEFLVQLRHESGAVELTIRDFGAGFDVETVTAERGLGLISMQERVNLVNGSFSIESAPMQGTTVRVRVPLDEDQAAAA